MYGRLYRRPCHLGQLVEGRGEWKDPSDLPLESYPAVEHRFSDLELAGDEPAPHIETRREHYALSFVIVNMELRVTYAIPADDYGWDGIVVGTEFNGSQFRK